MAVRKICVVSGSRSEYSLLYWLLRGIEDDPDLELQFVVTGMHLSSEFGMTYREIEEDCIPIADKLEILLSGDSWSSITKSIGLGTIRLTRSSKIKQSNGITCPGRIEDANIG
jgi:UDP-N-acetylglucosamine 2-epimerase (non-hydrolysing)/GDP/UDP-N,N'-diacetylbacillosamine 2-epimerase (hydrolysing)